MIKFFRKIRKTLADDNKPLKYLRYAIGEIALVVIGILIALSINNWNENQKEQKEINNFLKLIASEISSNSKSAADVIFFRDSSKYYSHQYFELIKANNLDMKDFSKVLNPNYNVFYNINLGSTKSGYNAFISSGLFGKLDNSELKTSLFDYYEFVESIEKDEIFIRTSIDFHQNGLLGELGAIEIYNHYFNNGANTAEQDIWFKKFVRNPHLSQAHFANIDDIGLQENYKLIIEQGNKILELLSNGEEFNEF